MCVVLVGHLNPYIVKLWITVSGAAGLESVVRKKKKKKKQDKIIPLNVGCSIHYLLSVWLKLHAGERS